MEADKRNYTLFADGEIKPQENPWSDYQYYEYQKAVNYWLIGLFEILDKGKQGVFHPPTPEMFIELYPVTNKVLKGLVFYLFEHDKKIIFISENLKKLKKAVIEGRLDSYYKIKPMSHEEAFKN